MPSPSNQQACLINKPLVSFVTVQCFFDAHGYLRSVQGAVKEAVNVATLVRPCKQIVELPHGERSIYCSKVRVSDIGLAHCVDLRICKQHSWDALLLTTWQCLVEPHSAQYLTELVFCERSCAKVLQQVDLLCRVEVVE